VKIVSYRDDDQAAYLERAAIRESGVSFTIAEKGDGGPVHISSRISYNASSSGFADGTGKGLESLADGAGMVYLSAGDLRGASVTDLVLASQYVSAGDIIVNNAAVRSLNTAEFIGRFYSGIAGGSGSRGSCRDALDRLRDGKFRHPSNWMGIRLYVRSL